MSDVVVWLLAAGQALGQARRVDAAVLDRIEAVDAKVDAFITVDKEGALAQADKADRDIAEGNAESLTGIPLSIKDLICTKGLRTTCASRVLENFIPLR